MSGQASETKDVNVFDEPLADEHADLSMDDPMQAQDEKTSDEPRIVFTQSGRLITTPRLFAPN
jgi:hypothetical protein